MRVNLLALLDKPFTYQKNWLANVITARQHYHRIQTNDATLQTISREQSYLLKWIQRQVAYD